MLTILIYNIIVLAIFAGLAILFNKWWIILFALIFFLIPQRKLLHKYFRICDGCGAHSVYTNTQEEALAHAEFSGWKHIESGNLDYCPECAKRLNVQ